MTHTVKSIPILPGSSGLKSFPLRAMANDPELNIGNNIGMRETQFFHMFLQKTL